MVGPFNYVHVQGRIIAVQNKNNTIRKTFNPYQIKPFCKEYENNLQLLGLEMTILLILVKSTWPNLSKHTMLEQAILILQFKK